MTNRTAPVGASPEVIRHHLEQHMRRCGCAEGEPRHAWCACRNGAALICANGAIVLAFARPGTYCIHVTAAHRIGCLHGWVEVDGETAFRWLEEGAA